MKAQEENSCEEERRNEMSTWLIKSAYCVDCEKKIVGREIIQCARNKHKRIDEEKILLTPQKSQNTHVKKKIGKALKIINNFLSEV